MLLTGPLLAGSLRMPRRLQLAKVVCGIVFLAHLLGCMWYWIADNAEDPETTWLSAYDGGSGLEAGVWTNYLYAVYW